MGSNSSMNFPIFVVIPGFPAAVRSFTFTAASDMWQLHFYLYMSYRWLPPCAQRNIAKILLARAACGHDFPAPKLMTEFVRCLRYLYSLVFHRSFLFEPSVPEACLFAAVRHCSWMIWFFWIFFLLSVNFGLINWVNLNWIVKEFLFFIPVVHSAGLAVMSWDGMFRWTTILPFLQCGLD